jgi:hypothetical protein
VVALVTPQGFAGLVRHRRSVATTSQVGDDGILGVFVCGFSASRAAAPPDAMEPRNAGRPPSPATDQDSSARNGRLP